MNEILARSIQLRSPFALKRIPLLARFHRVANQQRVSRKAQLLISAPLEKLFRLYYRWFPQAPRGEFEYQARGERRLIKFNARNLAFDIFYSDLFRENYEDETAVLLDTFLTDGACFYDIGSNWGYFSLYVASLGGSIRIHAFEPVPTTYGDLLSCVGQAGLQAAVQCHMLAMSDSNGRTFFQLPFHSASAQVDSSGGGIEVETRRIDSLDLEEPRFIKIDAEGHEAAVLRGGVEMIRRSHPFIMFENKLYRHAPQETLEPLTLLKELGYSLYIPTVQRKSARTAYLLNCGYQIDTARMQRINRQDRMALVPLTPELRFLFPAFLNIFACPMERVMELESKFERWHADRDGVV
jgi:FkbM family methyltransferase